MTQDSNFSWARPGLLVVNRDWQYGGSGPRPRVLLRVLEDAATSSRRYWIDRQGWEYRLDLLFWRPTTQEEIYKLVLDVET